MNTSVNSLSSTTNTETETPTMQGMHTARNVLPEGDEHASTQQKLTALLQTTIELEPLFDLFFGQLQHLLKLNSCHFVNEDKNIHLKLGKKERHHCNYTLSLQQQHLGTIDFSRKLRFLEDELTQLEILLSTLIYPLRNALNYHDALHQALCDPLTGLGNRSAMENALEYQWQMAQRYEQDLGLLMIDIDHFKKINDTFGHTTGDYVIQAVADAIKNTTRQTDLGFRYGGEEFMVLLTKTTPPGAHIIAERIRKNIEALKLKDKNDKTISVTISIGGTCLRENVDKQCLIKQADDSLYQAKETGRNCVVFYENALSSNLSGHLSL